MQFLVFVQVTKLRGYKLGLLLCLGYFYFSLFCLFQMFVICFTHFRDAKLPIVPQDICDMFSDALASLALMIVSDSLTQ